MLQVEFGGAHRLIEILDASVARNTPEEITQSVKDGLSHLIHAQGIELPSPVQMAGTESYGRHLLYRSDDLGYVVVAMAWGPGQGTPVHDHAGIWCVEAVWKGQLEVIQFDLLEESGDLVRFAQQGTVHAGPGSAGCLIPPFEYHTLSNELEDQTSISIHVYGRDLENCCIFEPQGDGWYRRRTKTMTYEN